MNYIGLILGLSIFATFALATIVMVIGGLIHRKIYYEPNSPPIEFKSHPVRFVCCVLTELAVAIGCIMGTVKTAIMVLDRL